MLQLQSGITLPLTVPAGKSLVIKTLTGSVAVTGGGSSKSCTRSRGANSVYYGPFTSNTSVTITTSGICEYDVVDEFPTIYDSLDTPAVAEALGSSVLGETTGTEAGLLAAMAAMNLMGGGVVKIKYQTYSLTATLPPYTNVTIEGAGWKPAYSDIPDSGSTQYGEGSRLLATGAFPIFAHNAGTWDQITRTNSADLSDAGATTLYGSGTTAQQAFSNTAITQSVFRNLCLDGGGVGTYGMIAGAMNKASFFYCNPAEKVMFVNFTKDPFRFENFIHINLPECRVFNCGSLGALGSSSKVALLQPGNSDINDLLGTIPSNSNLASRGLIVYARNASIHNLIKLVRVQCNRFNQTSYNETFTVTNSTPDIPVTDLSKYTEELPFVFSTNSYGLPDVVNNVGGTLYVLSRSGTSGAGTVRFSWQPGIASSLYTPTGTGSVTARTYGFPAIEATGYDTAQVSQLTIGPGSDVESGGTAQVQFSNCLDFYCDIKTPNAVSAYTPNIAVLGSPQGEIRGNGFPTIYLSKATVGMSASSQVRIFGTKGQGVGYLGIGMWKLLSGAFQVNMNAAADASSATVGIPTLAMDGGALWLPQSRGYIGSSLRNRFTTSKTISWNFDHGLVVMDGASAVCTLPVVDANSSGNFIPIYFAQAGSIATQSSQTLNGLGLTSVPVGAGAFVVAWAQQNNGTYSWTLLSSDLGALNGVGLRNAANDAAAAALSPAVPIGGLYRNGSVVQVRIA